MKSNAGLNCDCHCEGYPCACRCDHCGAPAHLVERLPLGDPDAYWPWICLACVSRYGGKLS